MALESDLSGMNIGGPGGQAAAAAPAPVSAPVAAPPAAAVASPVTQATPPQTPAPVSVSAVASPESLSLVKLATDRGYDPSQFKTEGELAAALFDAAERAQQLGPLATIGQQFSPYAGRMAEIEELLRQKDEAAREAAAAEAAKASQPPALDWRKVEYDPSWERYCELDRQTGLWSPMHPDFAQYARKLNDAQEARRQNAERLYNLPEVLDSYFGPRRESLEKTLLERVEKLIEEKWHARQQEAATQQLIREHEKEWYVCDATGKPVLGPDGQARLSPVGEAVARFAQEARELGIADPLAVQKYATNMVEAARATGKLSAAPAASAPLPAAGTPAAPGVPPANGARRRFLDRVPQAQPNRLQQRAGNIPAAAAPDFDNSPSPDLREIVDRKAKELGIQL